MELSDLISLLGGVALFLFGMTLMGEGLKKVAGSKLELVLYKLSSSPIKGVLLGTGVTAIIQSSSATSVMVVGFVNSGMMKVRQAIGIVLGAILGTSVTGWILCLSDLQGGAGWVSLLSTATLTGVVAVAGIILRMFCHSQTKRHVGDILLGFAVLMFGMQAMSGAVAPLRESQAFLDLLTTFSNPLLGILVGMAFTCVLQSASAAVGILQALAATGAINFAVAYPLTMGIAIGGGHAGAAVLPGGQHQRQAHRLCLSAHRRAGGGDLGERVLRGERRRPLLLPGDEPELHADRPAEHRLPPGHGAGPHPRHRPAGKAGLPPHPQPGAHRARGGGLRPAGVPLRPAPRLALEQSRQAVNNMAGEAKANLEDAFYLLRDYQEKKFQFILHREDIIDKYEDKLGSYLIQLTGKELTSQQNKEVTKYLHAIGDLERIGDHAMNIAECAKEIQEKNVVFSKEASQELDVLFAAVQEIVYNAITAFSTNDLELAYRVEPLEELIDSLCDEMKLHHVDRLQQGICTLHQGFVFTTCSPTTSGCPTTAPTWRVAMIELESDAFDTHQYMISLKQARSHGFDRYYAEYRQKFSLPGD